MDVILPSFILLLITQAWKWVTNKFGMEKSKLLIHGFLFLVSLIVACLKYWNLWDIWAAQFISLWAMASGEYEILKAVIEGVIGKKE